MNEHMLSIIGKRRQATFDRFLPRGSSLNPDHWLRRPLQQGSDGGLIQRLTDHTNPADVRCRKGGVQSPGQHRPAQQGQQELVAIRSHATAAAGGSDQQMHKRLLLPAG